MRFNIFLIIKVGYILVTEIKKAAKDKKITFNEAIDIIQKVCVALGVDILGMRV